MTDRLVFVTESENTMFSHPLARAANIYPSGDPRDGGQRTLIVVTTLKLDPAGKTFKADKVAALSAAAAEWVSFHQNEASSFTLVNRVKDW